MRSTVTVKDHYDQLLTGVYQEIQALDNMPGGRWEVSRQPEYGIDTWTLTEDKSLGRTGTNNQLQVKLFSSGSYDFVKTEDYLTRGQLVCDAAKRLINQYCANDPVLNKQFENWLHQIKSSFDTEIKDNCRINPEEIRRNNSEHFNDVHGKAKEALKQLLANAVAGLMAANPDLKSPVAALEQSEKELIMERGRPNVIKVGQVGDQPELRMMSAQFTRGNVTVPSTLREGNYPTKLSNHVLDCSAVLRADKTVDVKVMVDGHSSYTPINDRASMWSRVAIGTAALKEKITASVADILLTDPNLGTKDNPIQYSLSSMMMLTPLGLKAVENAVRKGESESEQLQESRIVMELVRSMPQPMQLNVNGRDVFVNVNHTFMNIPANELAPLQGYKESKIQENMNAHGVSEYIESMQTGMERFIQEIKVHDFNASQEFTGDVKDQETWQLVQKEKLQEREHLITALRSCNGDQAKLHSEDIQKLQFALRTEYKSLNYYLERDPNDTKQFEGVLKKIDAIESVLAEKQRDALARYQDIYHKPENVAELLKRMDVALQQKDLPPELKDYLVMQQRFTRAKDIYFKREYLNPENAYVFQALYLLSNAQMKREIEAFCKSGEDRTGWLRVTMLAITAYNATHGRDPDLMNKDDRLIYNKFYSSAAHELSASLENTAFNSASRGLQVSSKCTTTEKIMECDKAMATLAKTLFKGNLPAPSRSCKVVDGRLVALVGDEAIKRGRSNSAGSFMGVAIPTMSSLAQTFRRRGSQVVSPVDKRGSWIKRSGSNSPAEPADEHISLKNK